MASAGRARSIISTSICAILSISLFLGAGTQAGAVPPPPPNPSDQQIQDSQSTAQNSAAEVGRLSGLVSSTQGQITRLNDDMELKGELVKKALIDVQIAQSDAADAETVAKTAARTALTASGAITTAQDKAADFAAASFRQGSVLGSMTALMDSTSASDLLSRQQLLTEISKSQLDVIAKLQTTLSDKANLDSDARVARDKANVAKAAATQAEKAAEQAKQTADDAFVAGKAQLARLNTQLDGQENDYQLALSKVADLQNQRAQYNIWLAAKKAEEERIRLAKIAAAKKAAAEKLAAEQAAAAKKAAEAKAAAAEQARLQAIAEAEAKAAALKAAQEKAAALASAKIAKERADEQAQLRAQQAAVAAEQAAEAAAAAKKAASKPVVYYASCADAVAAGAAPINRGQPGYRAALDSNGNGIACEVVRSASPSDTSGSSGSSNGNNGSSSSNSGSNDNSGDSTPAPVASGGWSAAKGRAAVAAAEGWVGTPYAWGGGNSSGPTTGICGPNGAENDCNIVGFDCSGLTSYGWAQEGISIPNYSVYQYTLGQHVSSSGLMPGDLMFYANDTSDPSTIHHVAMYAGNGMMVEAPYSGAYVHVTSAEFGNGFIGATRPGT